MDPTAALTNLIVSLEPGDRGRTLMDAVHALAALQRWLIGDGSLPDVPAALAAAGYVEEGG